MSSIFLNNDVDNPYGSNRLVFFLRKPKPLEIATKNSRLTKDQLIRKMFVKTVDAYFVENAPANFTGSSVDFSYSPKVIDV